MEEIELGPFTFRVTLRTDAEGLDTSAFPPRFACEQFVTWTSWSTRVEWARPYAFVHVDDQGEPFYVGYGARDDAWAPMDDPVWAFHVKNNLGGCYHVVMLGIDQEPDVARRLRDAACRAYGALTAQSNNHYRPGDWCALQRYHEIKKKLGQCYDLVSKYKRDLIFNEMERTCRLALKLCVELYDCNFETNRFGEVLRQMHGAQHYDWFLESLVEQLLAEGRVDEARAEFLAFERSSHRASIGTPRTTRIRRMCERGTYKRRPRKTV